MIGSGQEVAERDLSRLMRGIERTDASEPPLVPPI